MSTHWIVIQMAIEAIIEISEFIENKNDE